MQLSRKLGANPLCNNKQGGPPPFGKNCSVLYVFRYWRYYFPASKRVFTGVQKRVKAYRPNGKKGDRLKSQRFRGLRKPGKVSHPLRHNRLAALQRNGLAVLLQLSTFNIRLIKGQTEIPQY
jgi:hypothetical protein